MHKLESILIFIPLVSIAYTFNFNLETFNENNILPLAFVNFDDTNNNFSVGPLAEVVLQVCPNSGCTYWIQ